MKPCCLDPVNIKETQLKPDTISKQCQVCQAKTIEVNLDMGVYNFQLSPN